MSATKTPLVCVIIPPYKGSPYIQQAIQRVFTQLSPNRGLIIFDDSSSDNTLAVVQYCIKKFRSNEKQFKFRLIQLMKLLL